MKKIKGILMFWRKKKLDEDEHKKKRENMKIKIDVM